MKDSARYIKIVEWSEEDQCYVGSSPGLTEAATVMTKKPCLTNCAGSLRRRWISMERTANRCRGQHPVATWSTRCIRSHNNWLARTLAGLAPLSQIVG